jgi:hypothetical protein
MKDPPGSKGETPDVAFEAELILEVLHKTKNIKLFFSAICCSNVLKQSILSRQQT